MEPGTIQWTYPEGDGSPDPDAAPLAVCVQPGIKVSGFAMWQWAWRPHYIFDPQSTCRALIMPLFWPVIAFALHPIWYVATRPRVKLGHCPCGYDLTGNTSGKCPECGAPIDVKADAE